MNKHTESPRVPDAPDDVEMAVSDLIIRPKEELYLSHKTWDELKRHVIRIQETTNLKVELKGFNVGIKPPAGGRMR